MINRTEIKKKNQEEIRVIFYDESNETSTGFLFSKLSLYDLYNQLREFYNEEGLKNE